MAPQLQMQDSKPERKYSNKYIEYLYTWDSSRRLKKSVTGPPEGFQHPGSIHGQRVVRLGKGIPPKDNHEEEVLKFGHRRRIVQDRSYQSQPDLLNPRPSTAPAGGQAQKMYLDENHQRALQKYNLARLNKSSMQGAGVMVTEEPTPHKPWRGRGSANPGWGLSEEMVQTLSFQAEGTKAPMEQRPKKLVWSIAPSQRLPTSSLLRHRMSDPANDGPAPKFVAERPMTPNLASCSAEERRTAFYTSLQDYAKNKVIGDFGSLRTSGLRTLAGFAR